MRKRLLFLSLFSLMPASFYYAQTTVYAYVKDAQGKPIENAEVDLSQSENDVFADRIGYFQLVNLQPGHYQITVSKNSFESSVMSFDVLPNEKRKDLGVIKLAPSLGGLDNGVVVLDESSNEGDNVSKALTTGLLQSGRDTFSSIAAFELGNYWFRPRGVDGRSSDVMINGISMNTPDDGNVDFNNWGGLNEITRYPEFAYNHAPSEYTFGGIGSVFYKNTKASEYRKGSQFTYSLTNRNYRNRLSYRYTSGMNKSGWAFTGMVARRWAEEGIQEGTYYDAYGYYLGIEKKISDKHTITFNAIGAPYKRSTASPNTQEVVDYRGVHYNAYWGWQDGRKRNERQREGFTPILQLSDYLKLSKKVSLWTTVSYQFGKNKASRLDWFNAPNPSPTYYRNLPSYWLNRDLPNMTSDANLANANYWDNVWKSNDQNYTQINWNNLYYANMNPTMDENEQDVKLYGPGHRAKYLLVNDVTDDKIWNANTHFTYDINDKTRFILNVAYQNYKSEQYREVKDLLGADYAINKDPFTKGNVSGNFNTLDSSVRKGQGDKIGYDYILKNQSVRINPELKFSVDNFDVFLSGKFAYSTNNREGVFKHYLYPNSYGKSHDKNFIDAGLKAQVTYKINGRHFLVYNGAYYTQSPFLNDLFVNARVSNILSPNIKSTIIDANDLSYIMSTPFVKMRLTGYIINTHNDTDVKRFYGSFQGSSITTQSADANSFVTEVLSNVTRLNMGVELGLQVKLTPTLTANGMASISQYTYKNNPHLYFLSDNPGFYDQSQIVLDDYSSQYKDMGVANLKDYKQGGTPQQAFSLGLRYNSPKYWWLGASWNYLGQSFLDPASAVRTSRFYTDNIAGTPYQGVTQDVLHTLLKQTQLPDTFFVNVNAGKSFSFGRGKYYLMLSASVNNLLDNKKYITGGFEQTRSANFSDYYNDMNSGHPAFGPKYFYNQGRSYFINLQVRF